MKESPLNADEIMALQWLGYTDAEIRRTSLAEFDRLYDENPRLESLLEKANAILDRQEAAGVITLPWHSERSPRKLLRIGDDCPAQIYLRDIQLMAMRKGTAKV